MHKFSMAFKLEVTQRMERNFSGNELCTHLGFRAVLGKAGFYGTHSKCQVIGPTPKTPENIGPTPKTPW